MALTRNVGIKTNTRSEDVLSEMKEAAGSIPTARKLSYENHLLQVACTFWSTGINSIILKSTGIKNRVYPGQSVILTPTQ